MSALPLYVCTASTCRHRLHMPAPLVSCMELTPPRIDCPVVSHVGTRPLPARHHCGRLLTAQAHYFDDQETL